MQFSSVLVGLAVRLDAASLHRHLPWRPAEVGAELSQQVDAYVRDKDMGYYPALEYFKDKAEIDQKLLDAVDEISWFVSKLVRETIQIKLRPIFSKVSFQSIQSSAYALPSVRPHHQDALDELSRHYTPNTVRVELRLSLMQKDNKNMGDVESYARKMMFRWLDDSFEKLEITSSVQLS